MFSTVLFLSLVHSLTGTCVNVCTQIQWGSAIHKTNELKIYAILIWILNKSDMWVFFLQNIFCTLMYRPSAACFHVTISATRSIYSMILKTAKIGETKKILMGKHDSFSHGIWRWKWFIPIWYTHFLKFSKMSQKWGICYTAIQSLDF